MVDLRARFGRLVKAHRVRLGLTQEALAERAGISTDMVSKIEGGASGLLTKPIDFALLREEIDTRLAQVG